VSGWLGRRPWPHPHDAQLGGVPDSGAVELRGVALGPVPEHHPPRAAHHGRPVLPPAACGSVRADQGGGVRPACHPILFLWGHERNILGNTGESRTHTQPHFFFKEKENNRLLATCAEPWETEFPRTHGFIQALAGHLRGQEQCCG